MNFIAGIDEAGIGPLAGPVVAACVILPDDFPVEILNDSKKLSEKKRSLAFDVIKEKSCWGIGIVSEKIIDEINILQADFKAMRIAFDMMMEKLPLWCKKNSVDFSALAESMEIIVDGNKIPFEYNPPVKAVVKADSKFTSVMAASILAKVQRDKIMVDYDKIYPMYGYAKHKGYPTQAHKEICRRIGPSPIQRLSFNYN
ncbi:ribonuclease HII [Treponema sp.]|uniref:ribonuclease HII n=1 Tax=Treponema sp. TaxID=166 RepID=UPI003F01AE85